MPSELDVMASRGDKIALLLPSNRFDHLTDSRARYDSTEP
jgi:hypothetical protein